MIAVHESVVPICRLLYTAKHYLLKSYTVLHAAHASWPNFSQAPACVSLKDQSLS